jgi:hypothetical protein
MKKSVLSIALFVSAVFAFYDTSAGNGPFISAKPLSSGITLEEMPEEEPVSGLLNLPTADDQVTIKVFDATGAVVLQKKVTLQELFGNSLLQKQLPAGSIFVYFNQHTAYYFLDNSGR